MSNNKLFLKKIPLQKFIEELVKLYNSGADYIDIGGSLGESQDSIIIHVDPEYMSNDDVEEKEEINLSDDKDLNQLI
jgi:hypothetical protein